MGSHHQNEFFELRIKVLNLDSRTLLLHANILPPESMITMLWHLSLNPACKSYNSLEMNKDRKTPEQKVSGVELQICPTDYHTWGCSIFFLEAPAQGGPTGIPKLEPRTRTEDYLGNTSFHIGSVNLVLTTRTEHVYPQYNVVLDDTFSTMDHKKKGTVPGNWKNLIEEHSELATQENYTIAK